MKKALIIFSGGIDSTVILAKALKENRECMTLSFDYGQRHRLELRAAKKISKMYKVPHKVMKIDTSAFGNSPLVSVGAIPKNPDLKSLSTSGIPSTCVPARNMIFLAFALGQVEINGIEEVYFGSNKDDFHSYPDFRPDFFQAFQKLVNVSTVSTPPQIMTPLINMSKGETIRLGKKLGVPFHQTLSCYDPSPLGEHCMECLSCTIREKGFKEASP